MRVAIIHYWLVGMRGGERVLEQICRSFPQADIFTHVLRHDRISKTLMRHRITCTGVSRLPFATTHYKKYLMFMPRALEELDLSGYDLVISSESGPAKGVITPPRARHISYCHSPMRYIWDQFYQYKSEMNWATRNIFSHVAHRLRQWDVTTAARVDKFVANSHFVAQRIERYYRRDAEILYPPVDLALYNPCSNPSAGYYLLLSELVPYKRTDLAIEAFRSLDRQLVVAGAGSELARLKAIAPANVRFTGRVSNEDLRVLYANCRALIFPGEEDFGIVPLEAMASGRPVIAYGAGGARETIVAGLTGLFFGEQTADALRRAIVEFEGVEARFDPGRIRAHAETFSETRFRAGFEEIVSRVMEERP